MTPSSNGTDICILQNSNATRASLGAILIFVFIIGGAGNSALSFMVFRHTEMRSVINILLALMSISDAFTSIFCAPLDLTSIILNQWIFGRVVCCIHAFLLSVFMVQNVTVLVIISIDRYYILVHKKNHLYGCSSIYLVLGCLIFAIIVSCPPLFHVGQFTFVNEHCGHIRDPGMDDIIYIGLFSSFLFVLPCGLLLLAYVHIIVTLRKTTHRIRPECQTVTCQQFIRGNQTIDVRYKKKTFTTILCLYVAAMAFKLPLAISLLVKSVTESVMCPVSLRVMVLTYMNSAVNPFIYAFKITTYWRVLTGKYQGVKNRVRSLRSSRRRSNPGNVYRISRPSTISVI